MAATAPQEGLARGRRGFPSLAALAALAALATPTFGCGDDGPTDLPVEPITSAGDYQRSFTSGGELRFYELHVPPGYAPESPVALVLAYHGSPGDPAIMRTITDLDRFSDDEGFAVAYPQGFAFEWEMGCAFCTFPDQRGVDDLRYTTDMLDRIGKELSVDASRIYAVGFSQGGLFVHRLACFRSERFAAVGGVGAAMLEHVRDDCDPPGPVPIVMIHGTEDEEFPWEGRTGQTARSVAVPDMVAHWTGRNGCGAEPAVSQLPDAADDGTTVTLERYGGCAGGSEVLFYVVEEGGHTWPGSPAQFSPGLGRKSLDLDATAALLDFFGLR